MQVQTERFGEIEVADAELLTFADGLPGFPDARRFALIEARDGVFFWLQSVDDPTLAFLTAVPWPFFPDYEPVVPDDDQEALAIADPDDALVLCLLTVHEEAEVTANLLGPLVVNKATRVGRQLVLADSTYAVRMPLAAA